MFEVEQHTADIRIRLRSATIEELFADAVRSLMHVMKPGGAAGAPPADPVIIQLEAPDLTALLVDYLNEVLLRCHTRRQSFEPESFVLREGAVTAHLRARTVPQFEEDVKAVTYHEANVVQTEDMWTTTLVLDV